MKIILLTLIVILFGLVGYLYNYSLKQQINFYQKLNKFNQYYLSSISLCKNDFQTITKNFEKNEIFIVQDNLIVPNKIEFESKVKDKQNLQILLNFYENLGKNDCFDEKNIVNEMISYIKVVEQKTLQKLNQEGKLFFKIMVAIGLVVAILIW